MGLLCAMDQGQPNLHHNRTRNLHPDPRAGNFVHLHTKFIFTDMHIGASLLNPYPTARSATLITPHNFAGIPKYEPYAINIMCT
jgi:hypothetical protein